MFGANGQLASDLIPRLAASGWGVIKANRRVCDISILPDVGSFLSRNIPDMVINCTAYHKLDACEKNRFDAVHINAVAPAAIAHWCDINGAKFIHFSTDYVFGHDSGFCGQISELDQPRPLQTYGKSKYIGEQMIQNICDNSCIIRTSSLFGKAGSSGKGGNFVETMLKKIRANEPIEVVGDVIMSPTSTIDLSDAIVKLLEHDPRGIYHITNDYECSWYDFACAIRDISNIGGTVSPVTLESRNEPFARPRYSSLSCGKINSLGITMRPWIDALEEYLCS